MLYATVATSRSLDHNVTGSSRTISSLHTFNPTSSIQPRNIISDTDTTPTAGALTDIVVRQSAPMAIPQACETSSSTAAPPPPLPPPRHISELSCGQDSAWQWANAYAATKQRHSSLASIKPGSTLLGLQGSSDEAIKRTNSLCSARFERSSWDKDEKVDPELRVRLPSCVTELRSLGSSSDGNHSLHSEEQLGQRSLEDSSQAYDKQLLSKIGKRNGATRPQALPSIHTTKSPESTSLLSNSHHEMSTSQLAPLSLSERRYSSIESPNSRWSSRPSSAAVSPAHTTGLGSVHDKSSQDPRRLSTRTDSGSVTEEALMMPKRERDGRYDGSERRTEENGVKDLNINDRSPGSDDYYLGSKSGMKRKASSPPHDPNRNEKARNGVVETVYNNGQQSQSSMHSAYSGHHASSGLSSSVSTNGQHNGSYGSSYAISLASSATSLMSGDRPSPNSYPCVAEPDVTSAHSPKSYFSSDRYSPELINERRTSQAQISPLEQAPKIRSNGVVRKPGVHMCDCCPKKPKKFKTKEELRAHEQEKQYTCQYCPNRFKNKNEAERHQNSLHLRRHSWSCAALVSVRDVFHPSYAPTAGSGPSPDACGYCGKEFLSDPPDWIARTDHLNFAHRFGECNQTKKFFRADHFRQHLKHSHAGSSGKWTNMLENACMRVEPPPAERRMAPPPPLVESSNATAASLSKTWEEK